jgi:phage gp29-like protein
LIKEALSYIQSKFSKPTQEDKTNSPKPNMEEVAAVQVQDKYSTYPSNGLTPVRLAQIFREADSGDVLRQMELFEEMEEKDPHLFSQLQTRKNAVTGLDFEIISFSDDEYDKRIADFVKEEIESIEAIEDVFLDLLDAIGKGIATSEIIWGVDSGRYVIDDIKWRHQKKFFWDENDSFKVMTEEFPNGMEIPDNKFIVHRYKARSGHPSRAGVLRVVAWMYLFKNYDVKDWVSFCEVFGMPLRLGKYNPSASEEDKEALMKALVMLGTDAAGIIPDNTEIDFKESSKTTSINVYEALAKYCDSQISKAILGQTLTSDSGGGSYAQSKTHNEVRHDLTVADCKALASTIRRDLIRPLVLFNFGEDKRIPYLRFDCEEAGDLKETAGIYKTLINDIGLKIATAHIYKKFSIPKPEANEEVVVPPALRDSQMQLKNMVKVLKDNELQEPTKEELDKLSIDYQKKIDNLIDYSVDESSEIFKTIFEPILKLVDSSSSLEEIKETLQNNKKVNELYRSMDYEKLEELLHKVMFYSDILGRMKENERPD